MSLIHPHSPQLNVAAEDKPSARNLNTLLTANTIDGVSTEVAKNAFDEYKKSELGLIHCCKKWTASVATYSLTLGIPVGTVCYATYLLLKDPVKAVLENPGSLFQIAYNNEPLLGGNNAVTNAIAPYTTPMSITATFAAIGTVDFAFKKTMGFAPARSAAKWTASMISTVLLYAAYKAGEITTASYAQQEGEQIKTRERSHKIIFDESKCTFDDMANGFIRRCTELINNPREMILFKNTAVELENRFPLIKKQLAKLSLTNLEIAQIMDKLNAAVKSVKAVALDLRQPHSEIDDQYNTELLSILSNKEFALKAIPRGVKTNITMAKANSLGVRHTVGSVISAAMLGLVTAVTVEISIPAAAIATTYFVNRTSLDKVWGCVSSLDVSSCRAEAVTVVCSLIPAVISGGHVAKHVYRKFAKEQKIANDEKVTYQVNAYVNLLNIYNGIATCLSKRRETVRNDLKAQEKLQQDAENIVKKLPLIHAQLEATQLFERGAICAVTDSLKTVLNDILSNKVPHPVWRSGFFNYFRLSQ